MLKLCYGPVPQYSLSYTHMHMDMSMYHDNVNNVNVNVVSRYGYGLFHRFGYRSRFGVGTI